MRGIVQPAPVVVGPWVTDLASISEDRLCQMPRRAEGGGVDYLPSDRPRRLPSSDIGCKIRSYGSRCFLHKPRGTQPLASWIKHPVAVSGLLQVAQARER